MVAKEKNAIVTGSGGMRGIGRGIALRFARDGYDVVLVDVKRALEQLPPGEIEAKWRSIESVASEVMALGQRALPIYADISDSAQVDNMVAAAVAELGGINVLVNNARAVMGRDAPVVDMDESQWDRTMAVNAKGTFLCSRAVARHFIEKGTRGKIINIGSGAANVGQPRKAAYSASKFAIVGFTQSLALELASYGISVNCVCPGLTDTGRFSFADKLAAESRGMALQEYGRRRLAEGGQQIPLGRVATPQDIANMVAFLASPQGSHITGQTINVNGGQFLR
ncbi:MAG: SDR family oxidoreductase [Chloroflexi bacterium]|nr:SDR family oxidoreductase [Chloroflexota bacterium]